MKINYFFFLLVFMYSCINPKQENIQQKNVDSTKYRMDLLDKLTSAENPIRINNPIMDSAFKQYKNTNHTFSIYYPKDWDAIENYNPLIVFMAFDKKTENETNFNVVIIPNEERSLDEVYIANKSEMTMYIKNIKFLGNDKSGKIYDLNFKRVISEFVNPQSGLKQITITYLFVKNTKSYIITFSTKPTLFEKNIILFNSIIQTIKIN